MEKAIEAVNWGTLSVRWAAEVYCIPKSTLHDQISGKVVQGASSGPEPYLNVTEETKLIQFLTKCASVEFSRSKKQIFDIVDILESKGKNVKCLMVGDSHLGTYIQTLYYAHLSHCYT